MGILSLCGVTDMNKLGPELMVTVTSSDNEHKRFSELIMENDRFFSIGGNEDE